MISLKDSLYDKADALVGVCRDPEQARGGEGGRGKRGMGRKGEGGLLVCLSVARAPCRKTRTSDKKPKTCLGRKRRQSCSTTYTFDLTLYGPPAA